MQRKQCIAINVRGKLTCWIAGLCVAAGATAAEPAVCTMERKDSAAAGAEWKFSKVPPPARNDAATDCAVTIIDGRRDANGGTASVLVNGRLPLDEDAPQDNFFFAQREDGGRLLLDLRRSVRISSVNTYSWHANTRGPQVYKLFASQEDAPGFQLEGKRPTSLETAGWHLLAAIDTRTLSKEPGGQYGVSITASNGTLATCRYLLFDVQQTESTDSFGNTFYSEIDVIEAGAAAPEPIASSIAQGARETVEIGGGKYVASIDLTETPDLADWVKKEIVPMIREWYPKLIEMLPSEGFEAPAKFSIVFDPQMNGVAATSGTRIRCAARWIRRNLEGEAKGAIFHEMVHVVQQYGRGRVPRENRPPGWLTEGITDCLRFYHFEPQTRGAEITTRNLSRARYDASYRITANFLNWVCGRHGADFLKRLNSAIREGKYSVDFWKAETGHTLETLGADWLEELNKKLKS